MKTTKFKVNDKVVILGSNNTFAVGEIGIIREIIQDDFLDEYEYGVEVIGTGHFEYIPEGHLILSDSANRSQVIYSVAKAYAYNGEFHNSKQGLQDAITLGAQWADSHPQYQWIKVDHRLPGEGQVVFIAVRDETGYGVNVATFEKGVFNSYSTDTPDYWMPVPALKEV